MYPKTPDQTYSSLAKEEKEREVELAKGEGEDGDKSRSLSEKLDEIGDLTDMQSAVKQLFPGELGGKIYNALMIARIAPDVFIPMLRLIVVEIIMQSAPNKPISVVEVMTVIYTLASIGLDGKGRIDQIELAGASKDTEELEALGKGLFG